MVAAKSPSYTPVNQAGGSPDIYLYERLARIDYGGSPADILFLSMNTHRANRILVGILAQPHLPAEVGNNIEYALEKPENASPAIPLRPITAAALEDLCTNLTKQGFSITPHPQMGLYTVG